MIPQTEHPTQPEQAGLTPKNLILKLISCSNYLQSKHKFRITTEQKSRICTKKLALQASHPQQAEDGCHRFTPQI
jgi:hypothetical protein